MRATIDVHYASRKPWSPPRTRIALWVAAALGRRRQCEVSVRVVGSAESRRLNRRYRRKDKPTNVLSFPIALPNGAESASWEARFETVGGRDPDAEPPGTDSRRSRKVPPRMRTRRSRLLGDIVVCAPIVAREAREQRKSRDAHWAHMIVHGTLHLLGYDHEGDADAKRMERREIAILRSLGVTNPYG